MSSKYEMTVSFTPVCSSCGGELEVLLTMSRHDDSPFNRDNPYERKDRRVMIQACDKCFVFRGDLPAQNSGGMNSVTGEHCEAPK